MSWRVIAFCDGCGDEEEVYEEGTRPHYWIEIDDEIMCESCSDNWNVCEQCEVTFWYEDGVFCYDCSICNSPDCLDDYHRTLWKDTEDKTQLIRDYDEGELEWFDCIDCGRTLPEDLKEHIPSTNEWETLTHLA